MRFRNVTCGALLVTTLIAPSARAGDEGAAPKFGETQHFTIDPVVDGVLIVGGLTFSELLSRIIASGEIRPTAPGNPNNLLSIDHWAVTQTIDPHANLYSNVGLWTAYGYALLDPILSGVRDGRDALLVDAIMYAESISITEVLTGITKIGVRRPRPIDYMNCADAQTGSCATNTDLQLSFWSGHASTTASIAATATYLAFIRSPHTARPWVTLAAGTLLTAFVGYERVRAGEHFPTDVIMGSMAGAGIGVLVPHFHRRPHLHKEGLEAPPLWIGFAPTPRGDATVTLSSRF